MEDWGGVGGSRMEGGGGVEGDGRKEEEDNTLDFSGMA